MADVRGKFFVCCLVASVFLAVKGQELSMYDEVCQLEGLTPDSLRGRIGGNSSVECTKLGAFIKQVQGTSNTFEWRYCLSDCYSKDAKWLMLAKMDGRGNIHVPNKKKYSLTKDGKLEVKNAQPADEGIYRGTLKKEYTSPEFCFVIFRVTRAPTITKKSSSHVAFVEGSPLYLVIEADGFPVPSISWMHDGEVVRKSTSQTSYMLDKAEKKDAGMYTCLVSNPLGSDIATVEVSIVADKRNTTLEPTAPYTKGEDGHNTIFKKDPTTSHNGGPDFGSGIAIGIVIGFALCIVCFCVWRVVCGRYQPRVDSPPEDEDEDEAIAMSSLKGSVEFEDVSDDAMIQA